MTPAEAQAERVRVHDKLREELFRRQNSNSDNFDKSILAYSTAGLGISLAFLKDFIPVTHAAATWLLYLSWAAFVMAVVLTMTSFVASQFGIKIQLQLNERYYLHGDEGVLQENNLAARATDWLNYTSGAVFLLALVATTTFVALNLERAAIVRDQQSPGTPLGAMIPGIQRLDHGAPERRGAVVPGIQVVPAPPPASSGGQPAPVPAPSPASSGKT